MASGTTGATATNHDASASTRRRLEQQVGKVLVFSLASTVLVAVLLRRMDPLFLAESFGFFTVLSVAALFVVLVGHYVTK